MPMESPAASIMVESGGGGGKKIRRESEWSWREVGRQDAGGGSKTRTRGCFDKGDIVARVVAAEPVVRRGGSDFLKV